MLNNLETNICHYICDNSIERYQQYRTISLCRTGVNCYVLVLVTTEGKNASPVYDSKQCGFSSSAVNIPGIWTEVALSLNIHHHFDSLKCIWSFGVYLL